MRLSCCSTHDPGLRGDRGIHTDHQGHGAQAGRAVDRRRLEARQRRHSLQRRASVAWCRAERRIAAVRTRPISRWLPHCARRRGLGTQAPDVLPDRIECSSGPAEQQGQCDRRCPEGRHYRDGAQCRAFEEAHHAADDGSQGRAVPHSAFRSKARARRLPKSKPASRHSRSRQKIRLPPSKTNRSVRPRCPRATFRRTRPRPTRRKRPHRPRKSPASSLLRRNSPP